MSFMSLHSKIKSEQIADHDQQARNWSRNHNQTTSDFDFDQHFYRRKKKSTLANAWDLVVGQGYAIADNLMDQPEFPEFQSHSFRRPEKSIIHIKVVAAFLIIIGALSLMLMSQVSFGVELPPTLTNDTVAFSSAESPPIAQIQPSTTAATISPVFSPEVQRWESLIISYAEHFNVDPNAVATVMQIESCGDPYAESVAGAQGLFQVMPFHFESNEDMKDPATNAMRGIAYLALGIDLTNGDIGRAMAGYNGGHSIANKDSRHWASETQRYYYWGTGIYADALAGAANSERLNEWMQAGGSSLCSQAASRNIVVLGY